MALDDFNSDLVLGLLRNLPVLLAALFGFIFALIFWRRHPRVSALILAGSSLVLTAQGVHIYWEYLVIPELEMQGAIPETLDGLLQYGLPWLSALGFGLILLAAFVGRQTVPHLGHFDDE